MKNKKLLIGSVLIISAILLAACGGGSEDTSQNQDEETTQEDNQENTNTDSDSDENMESESGSHGNMDHSGMSHSSSGEVPDDLQEAENPTYEVESQAIIESDHMEGMQGAEATIDGAYNTTVYTVSYTPTNGGDPVENHKWVIHEELENPGEAPLEAGTEVTINASHMEGMDGATAEIDSAEETTVYMVSFTPTNSGEEVSNHKWVTEGELSPVE
ncbi:YdhK family protein [Oceanobacillus kimchii]|uniref:DUF1541 domain-containing protein n=1 Tax=Oceanobacillus kimchii TaxID=746691 RepID=A0ABQ5TG16_9BACI|nr:YdhK family protein [Oceanobacillus kimchii]GLO65087.1 hypothetical protein MACH08_08710 [Oceanobacillus kimchii]